MPMGITDAMVDEVMAEVMNRLDVVNKVALEVQEDAKKQKKDGSLTEDEQKAAEKSIQDITDKCTKKIEEIQAKKEKEIMQI